MNFKFAAFLSKYINVHVPVELLRNTSTDVVFAFSLAPSECIFAMYVSTKVKALFKIFYFLVNQILQANIVKKTQNLFQHNRWMIDLISRVE